MRVADIVVDPRSGGIEATYTYRVEENASIGDAFFVPLGSRTVIGFAVRVYETSQAELDFPIGRLRSVSERIEGLSLPGALMELVQFVAQEYLCPLSLCISTAAPPAVKERISTSWRAVAGIEPDSAGLSAVQREVLRTMVEEGGTLFERPAKKIPQPTIRALKALRGKGFVEQLLELRGVDEKSGAKELLRLSSDAQMVESFLHREGKRRPAQALTIMRLQSGPDIALSRSEIKALSGITDSTIKAMLESGLLEPIEHKGNPGGDVKKPNPAQQQAIEAIRNAIREEAGDPFLLFGVTGSGKTEVYLRCAAEALKKGRQVLYLVPEIALATHSIGLLRERFGDGVALLHSDLPPRERLETWMQIRKGNISVVLGARSALFAPFENLGLIIVDEEHEGSYKQESAPRYHTKKLAQFLSKKHGAALVLGSATPSIETFYEAEQGALRMLELPERAAAANLPSVDIIDLTEGYKSGRPSVLGPELQDSIARALNEQRQIILFLNRRAYSPFLICRDCGHQFMCPRCAVSLAFSRSAGRLRCHHCGYSERPPSACPACHGNRLNPFGIGTEKVEESAKELFPGAVVARLDRDIARKKGALEDILARFRAGDIDILVGTQMVAKGLDFENVTLVGVIAADMSLNVPDFRSSERTFQLLSQVAGRAGRGRHAGHVIVQTFNPTHPAIACAQTHDYRRFYRETLQERSEALYPPYIRLVNLILSGIELSEVRRAAEHVGEMLQQLDDAIVLGPTECAIARLQSKWRMHLLIKLPYDQSSSTLKFIIEGFESKNVSLVVDVDPYSLM